MQTKLTLTIEQTVIERAKQYARSKNRSVSKLVEEYLSNVAGQLGEIDLQLENAPITKGLIGRFATQDSKQDYKALLEAALLEKHQ